MVFFVYRFYGIDSSENKCAFIPLRSGYSYKVAVALSLFLGWLGADRFYLGYPALGIYTHMCILFVVVRGPNDVNFLFLCAHVSFSASVWHLREVNH